MNLYERAAIIPGRSMTRSKAPGRFYPVDAGWPLYCTDGEGCRLKGEDGRWYIDVLCALGAISLGYRRTERMSGEPAGVYSLPLSVEVEAAEAALKHVAPWASSVRFLKTGSEATHAAYRIAKAATGRNSAIVGDWAYHGWHEWCTDAARIIALRHGEVSPNWVQPAAVFIEPHRWETVDPDWIKAMRAYCDRVGALLIFDSMIYGGRFALGGASQFFGVTPDLECFGKAFGNGESVAFVVGREAMRQHGEIASGTYSGDATGLRAFLDVLEIYKAEHVVERLWSVGSRLADGLNVLRHAYDDLIQSWDGAPVHQRLTFKRTDDKFRFSAEMAKRGVLWHPDVTNIMAAHTVGIIDEVIHAAEDSLRAMRG